MCACSFCLSPLRTLLVVQAAAAAFDVAFLVQFRRDEIREEENANSSAMSINSRIKFEKLRGETEEMILRVREKQVTVPQLCSPGAVCVCVSLLFLC